MCFNIHTPIEYSHFQVCQVGDKPLELMAYLQNKKSELPVNIYEI